MLTHLDLFSGIGGFALAARWAGIETVQFVEIDPFCCKVLQKNFPGVRIHHDIKTFTYSEELRGNRVGGNVGEEEKESISKNDGAKSDSSNQPIFLLTGGFPCQPFSCAGKRRGKEDDRFLWPEMLRVVREAKPRWVIAENVLGIVNIKNLEQPDSEADMEGEAFDGGEDCEPTGVLVSILSDLEASGYSVQVFIIPACAVNAPHRRDRVWIVAHSQGGESGEQKARDGRKDIGGTDSHAPDTDRDRPQEPWAELATGGSGQFIQRGEPWSEPWLEVATRLCRVDDGLPRQVDRVNRLKSLGNAIVPQVAYEIMKAIVEVEYEIQPEETD